MKTATASSPLIILIRHLKGGSGATLVAINLAYEMSQHMKTLLVQASPHPDLDAYLPLTPDIEMQKYESMWVSHSIDEAHNFECIVIDMDEVVGTRSIDEYRKLCQIECIIMNFDPASLLKTRSIEPIEKTFFVINQYIPGNPLSESYTKHSSRIIAKIPPSSEEVGYQLSRKEPFQKRKNGVMKSSIILLAQNLKAFHKQNI